MSSSLTLAAFLSLANTCAPGIAPETLAAIVQTESRMNPIAINVNGVGGGTIRVRTKAEAIAKARDLMRAGRSFDAGIAQINNRNWEWLGVNVETVFDPCQNIKAQANLLTSYSRYNTGSPTRGLQYAARVQANRSVVRQQTNVRSVPARVVRTTCPGAPPRWDAWGTARHVARCAQTIQTLASNAEYP